MVYLSERIIDRLSIGVEKNRPRGRGGLVICLKDYIVELLMSLAGTAYRQSVLSIEIVTPVTFVEVGQGAHLIVAELLVPSAT